MHDKGQILSDSALNNVSGGMISKYEWCEAIMDFFGADLDYCSESYEK